MPIILATQEADIKRVKVESQSQANSSLDCILNTHHKKRAKHETLSSNPSAAQKNKKERKKKKPQRGKKTNCQKGLGT
jgi:hypothetical protein